MAKRQKIDVPQSKSLGPEDLRIGIRKIERRLEELRSFDVNQIEKRFDAKAEALVDKINGTLADIFVRDTPEYKDYEIWRLDTLPLSMGAPEYSISEIRQAYSKGISNEVTKLSTARDILQEKLADYESTELKPEPLKMGISLADKRQVFIVHGHDELAKQTVARFISQMNLEPIILHEQPTGGKTIIEKLLSHSGVPFAVVLLTPDDVGHPLGHTDQARPRARQNVIMELGLFLGAIGRERVCALCKGDLEIPSDYHGVIYVQMDPAGAWKLTLAREMKQAGVSIDMNRAI